MTRDRLYSQLCERILQVRHTHPVRVAIDGIDAAGKTLFADELADHLRPSNRDVIRASLDGFHQPRARRYRRGPDSPEGYYRDSFDYPALQEALLNPLGPGGDRRYRPAVFDFRSDSPVVAPVQLAAPEAILLLDGIFLLRPELVAFWDYHIFLEVDLEIALQRGIARDGSFFGSPEAARARYLWRYLPAQREYLESARPRQRADLVIGYNDPAAPVILKGLDAVGIGTV